MAFGRRHSDSKAKERRLRAQAAGRVASERRVRIAKVVTCLVVGALFLALALVVGDADYHATPIGWIPFLCYVLLILAAWGYLQVLKRGLSFSESLESNSCKRDAQVPFKITFSNKTPLFFFSMDVRFVVRDLFGNPTGRRAMKLSLAPHESREVNLGIRFAHVGRYKAGLECVVISDFLGLFTHTIANAHAKTVCVSPCIYPLGKMEFSDEALEDSAEASKAVLADSMDYAYVREYAPGDPLKTIHWKLSAKAGEYMTRLFEVYTNPSVALFMDFYAPCDDADDLMGIYDAVIESCFSIARYAQQEGMETSVRYVNSLGEHTELDNWTDDAILRFVGDVPAVSNDPAKAHEAVDLLRRSVSGTSGANNVVVCSSQFSPELIEVLTAAKLNGRTPLLVGVVPLSLVDRDREEYCKPLQQLQLAGIDYMIVARAQEMRGVVA